MSTGLRDLLTLSGFKLTKPRAAVFELLEKSDDPMSITDVVKQLPEIDKVSVYRTIELFRSLHIVATVYNGWKQLYELAEPFNRHHHHLVCAECGSLTEIHSDKLERVIKALTNDNGFVATGHHFEITGYCGQCRSGN